MKFNFYLPTRIVVGSNCVIDNSPLLADLGKRAFIMTGASSAEKNGSLADMKAALEKQGIEWKLYNKVQPNPSLEDVRLAALEARSFKADFVVALGGGSPMDAAKAVAVLAAGEVTDAELLGQRKFAKVLPLVAVPTTSGTGSEVTPYSILTNDSLQTKSFLNSEQVYPRISFLDGRYTLDLPASVTAATVVDALSHAVEGYLAVRAIPLGQCLALEALRIIGRALPVMASGSSLSLDQREELLYASMLAGIVISQSGTTAVHAMGYSLTYFKGIDHGVANGLLMTEYLKFVRTGRPEAVDAILQALGGGQASGGSDSLRASSPHSPTLSLDSLGTLLSRLVGTATLSADEAKKFAGIAIKAGNIQNTNPKPTQDELEAMLCKCFVK